MSATIEQLIQSAGELPSMPQVTQRALAIIRNPEADPAELASILSMDQVLTSLVLRWSNSAYFGIKSRVATVHHAIMVLGFNTLRELLLASSVARYLNRSVPGYDLKQGELWRHSMGVATGARIVTEHINRKLSEEAYYAGLLCDIGKLAFEKLLRTSDASLPEWNGNSFLEMERIHFGVDHAMLGAEMARRWHLPDELVAAIAYHHNPSEAQDYAMIASAVHVADAAMMMLGVGVGKDGLKYNLDPEALTRLKMDDQDMLTLLDKIIAEIQMAEILIGV
jgi:putative nucleotidyltransferase with HDIG domain